MANFNRPKGLTCDYWNPRKMYKGNPNLPSPPLRMHYETYEEHDEAMGFWRSRIKHLMRGVSTTAPSEDSPLSETEALPDSFPK